jgi:hypothetical protein
MMKPACKFVLGTLIAGLLLWSAATPAMAQTALYGAFSATHVNNAGVADGTWLYGPTFGMYRDTSHTTPVHLGYDVRASFVGGGGVSMQDLLLSPRISLHMRMIPLSPYAQIGGGITRVSQTGTPSTTTTNTEFEYQILGGVDWTLLPHVQWRVLEYSYGSVSGMGASFNPKSISSGVVFRIP